MFDKFKQLNDLRKLQKQIKELKADAVAGGVKAVINGNLEVEKVELNAALDHSENARLLKQVLNDGMRQMQKKVSEMMQGSGLNLP